MDFTTIGKIGSYVKRQNLAFAAKHKIKTGQTLTNANGNLLSVNTATFDKLRDVSKIAADKSKQIKLRRIKNKLLSGKKLSEDEMGFLRVNDPKTYKKAKNAEEAREELKAELKRAKSKEEAQEAMARALVKASSAAMAELGALAQGGGIASAGGNSVLQTSGDLMGSGDVSTAGNVAGADVQTNTDTAQVSGNVNTSTGDAQNVNDTSADKMHGSQQNQDGDKDTPEDILEKYIMTIRALEDEWAQFTNSDEYKNLPEQTADDAIAENVRKIKAPDRRRLTAAALYRRAMLLTK